MAYISTLTTPDNTTYYIKPYTTILNSTNLNDTTGTGFYTVSNCTNSKYTTATLIVTKHGNNCTQVEVDVSTGAIATRTYNGSSWSAWIEAGSNLVATYDANGNVTIAPMTAVLDADSTNY